MDALRKLNNQDGSTWEKHLPSALSQLRRNIGPHGYSAYQILFGRDPLVEGLLLPTINEAEDATQCLAKQRRLDATIQPNLDTIHHQRQQRQSARTNPVEYQPGMRVWVLRPRREQKLSTWWTGPHIIQKQLGSHTWQVDVGNKPRACHTMQLKPWVAPIHGQPWPLHHHQLQDPDQPTNIDEWNVDKIVRHRRARDGSWEFLTRWEGFGPEDDQWEPNSNFLQRVNLPWLQY